MKYLLLLLMLSTSNLQAYIGEEIDGLWSNPMQEMFIEFESGWNYEKKYTDGNFHYYHGGNYSQDGTFILKGNKLMLYFERESNMYDSRQLDFKVNFIVELSTLKSGLRYIKLNDITTKGKNKWIMAPLYFRIRESAR